MPVKVRKDGRRYRVIDGGGTAAKGTTKARRQGRPAARVAHGWKPPRKS